MKHFERTDHARPLIICPAPLVEMWEIYNEKYRTERQCPFDGLFVRD